MGGFKQNFFSGSSGTPVIQRAHFTLSKRNKGTKTIAGKKLLQIENTIWKDIYTCAFCIFDIEVKINISKKISANEENAHSDRSYFSATISICSEFWESLLLFLCLKN